LGTALTPEQAKLIRRKAGENGEIVIVYDGDAAGQRATRRALDIFAMEGAACKVAVIPGGADPDDFVRANGGQAFREMPLLTATDYLLDRERESLDLGSLEGRTAYATAAAKVLRTIESPLEVENYVKRLMVETGFPRDVLYEQIGRTPKTRLTAQVSGNTRNQYRDTIREKGPSDDVKAQQQLLNLLCAYGNDQEYGVSVSDFTDPLCRELAQVLLPARDGAQAVSKLLNETGDEQKSAQIAGIFAQDIIYEPDQVPSMIRGYLRTIRHRVMENRLEELAHLMDSAAKESRREEMAAYQSEFAKISQLLSR
jgi:DNA primase